jgi:hypothetical protein
MYPLPPLFNSSVDRQHSPCSGSVLYYVDTAGNETVTDRGLLRYLEEHNYALYIDQWNEMFLYNGRQSRKAIDVDKLLGSEKFHFGKLSSVVNGAVHADLALG